jgi:anti-sigma-K factor RskA
VNAILPEEPFESGDLAGEYVLGVLSAAERRAASDRVQRDRAFAREVGAWERRLAPLAADIAPVAPPMYMWHRIRAALGHGVSESSGSIWDRLGFWRWLTAGALALATASLVALYVGRAPSLQLEPPPALVAIMALDNGTPAFVATIDRARNTIVVTPVTSWSDAAHVPELWLIPPGDHEHSLGVIGASKPVTIVIPANLRGAIDTKAIVAVSVEPPGGSPTGRATGPIIAKGAISGT